MADEDVGGVLLPGDDDLIVSVDETKLSGANDFLIVPAIHTYIMDQEATQKAVLNFFQHGYFKSEKEKSPLP